MSPSFLQVLLHIGSIIALVKDVEKSIGDLVAKRSPADDMKAVLGDVLSLISSGLIAIPGLSQEQLASVVEEIEGVLLPQAVAALEPVAAPVSSAV